MIPVVLASLVGLGLGVAGALVWARRPQARTALRPVGQGSPAALPPGLSVDAPGPRVWVVPDREHQRALVGALALALARDRSVVLAPSPASRQVLAELLSGERQVLWLAEQRPGCGELLDAIEALEPHRRPCLLVEGRGALEQPEPDEPSYAVVEELLEESEHPTIVILTESDRSPRPPALRLRTGGPGLVLDDGTPVLAIEDGVGALVSR